MNDLVERWVQVWREVDPEARRKAVDGLWAEDGIELTTNAEYQGHDALFERVTSVYERFSGEYVFVSAGDVAGHRDMVVFTCHMLPVGGEEVQWRARVVLLLDPDGRIRREDQIELT